MVIFDIDGVVRDVSGSYRRAIADTVEHFTAGAYRPTSHDIDHLKSEGCWNNDWKASEALIRRYSQGQSATLPSYDAIVQFFQGKYRGTEPDPQDWSGYITQEPLLMSLAYVNALTSSGLAWGFFSGATRGSATYILEKRLGLENPVLIAMEDAPGKPDPTGLLATIQQLEALHHLTTPVPVLYVGDTVADLQTIQQAKQVDPTRQWYAIGVLPPHVLETVERQTAYRNVLQMAQADLVFDRVEDLNPSAIATLLHH
jgi:HAD superfamily phosphatase